VILNIEPLPTTLTTPDPPTKVYHIPENIPFGEYWVRACTQKLILNPEVFKGSVNESQKRIKLLIQVKLGN
jgi:hypothetical protein